MKIAKTRISTAALRTAIAVTCTFGASQLNAQAQAEHESVHRGTRLDGHWLSHPAKDRADVQQGHVRPHSWIRDAYTGPAALQPQARNGPGGFRPADMQTAYGINQVG